MPHLTTTEGGLFQLTAPQPKGSVSYPQIITTKLETHPGQDHREDWGESITTKDKKLGISLVPLKTTAPLRASEEV